MKWGKSLEYLGIEDKKDLIITSSILGSLVLFFINPILAFFPPGLALGLPIYLAEVKRAKMRGKLPEIAIEISSLWGAVPLPDILEKLDVNALKDAGRMIKSGTSVKAALEWAMKREPEIKPVAEILLFCYKTGVDASKMLNTLAEGLGEKIAMEEETKASLTIEKITILAASGIVVPFVLGAMLSLSGSLDFASFSGAGISQVSPEVKDMAILGSKIYVGLYAMITSVYLAISGGSIKKALFYASIIFPVSILVFLFSSSISF